MSKKKLNDKQLSDICTLILGSPCPELTAVQVMTTFPMRLAEESTRAGSQVCLAVRLVVFHKVIGLLSGHTVHVGHLNTIGLKGSVLPSVLPGL